MGFSYCRTKKQALSFERLMYEIGIESRPVMFTWAWSKPTGGLVGGGHMMVAGGYKTINGQNLIEIYDPKCGTATANSTPGAVPADPSPACDYQEVPYSVYVSGVLPSGTYYVHWDDFYEIKKP